MEYHRIPIADMGMGANPEEKEEMRKQSSEMEER